MEIENTREGDLQNNINEEARDHSQISSMPPNNRSPVPNFMVILMQEM